MIQLERLRQRFLFRHLHGTCVFFGCCACATPALAIPSPELVIGSVSSLSQIFAVGFAVVSGTAAAIGAKFGFKRKEGAAHSTFLFNSVIILVLLFSASLGYIFHQSDQKSAAEQARLQETLVRPAQFAGTKIQDETLKETSFSAQSKSSLGISTADAAELLASSASSKDTLFLDVRERAEYQMGTLPGARHIRFPDIQGAGLDLNNKRVVLLCHNGNRSSETCARLAAMGIDCKFISGGLEKWIVEGRKFTNSTVRGLSDLRALPDYKNKETLISTAQFKTLVAGPNPQIVDTRYPKDFALGHLPNAINIPLRALPTAELEQALSKLENRPTVVACYDRRSCFMGQVLGYELAERGIGFLGRYTTPWDYFIAPPPKPHVQKWLVNQNKTLWNRTIDVLAAGLLFVAGNVHFLVGILALSLMSRLLILPISVKSEKDQIAMAAHKAELEALKARLKHDPVRRARAVQDFHKKLGLTPLRNLTALLFLPVMMLGLSAIERAAPLVSDSFLWVSELGAVDPFYIFPVAFCLLAGVYLQMTLATTSKRRVVSWAVVVPLLFGMVYRLSAAGAIYLTISLTLLLLQRGYVTGALWRMAHKVLRVWQSLRVRYDFKGILPLQYSDMVEPCGNKAYRLAVLANAGFQVPKGAVVGHDVLVAYVDMSEAERSNFFDRLWRMVDRKTCVVRSSGSAEDGADQSFAGVYDSVLDVDRRGLQDAFERVLGSFRSSRTGAYQGGGDAGHRGNILIQQMVDADYSGVLFTQDPMAPGQILVELAQGTADDLVSGRVTPLSMRFGKFTHQKCDETVPPVDIAELLETGREVERLFGCPQDIEWTYQDGKFSLVQSRDITTLDLGSETEMARQTEWVRLFDKFGNSTIDGAVLKQDEMSEVLPRPTHLSFSIMSMLWAPGGSVDQACRALGLTYKMPEAESGHLVQLFGKVYSDTALKASVALRLPRSVARSLENRCGRVEQDFHHCFLPALHKELAYWDALDVSKLSLENQLELVQQLTLYFVDDVYVMAEQINILANFLGLKAETECKHLGLDALHPLQAPMTHSPNRIMANGADLPKVVRKEYLLQSMGHRALFDYELSMPRYSEIPETLWKLAQTTVRSHHVHKAGAQCAPDLPNVAALALRFQDLKEQAKHESLRVFAVLRKVLLAIDHDFGCKGLVFHLRYQELLEADAENHIALKNIAASRAKAAELTKELAPSQAAMSLHECELLSNPFMHLEQSTGDMQGICVSGDQDVVGSVFWASDTDLHTDGGIAGFAKGDILVCKMMNPVWLPYVLQSGAVICEVGGWLSHMAIVAREHNIPMVVGCAGLERLQNGDDVTVSRTGEITVRADEAANVLPNAEAG